MLIRLHPEDPQPRHVKTIIECLLDGGVIVYPTDTIYGLGCDIFKPKAIEKICRIKNIDPAKAQLEFGKPLLASGSRRNDDFDRAHRIGLGSHGLCRACHAQVRVGLCVEADGLEKRREVHQGQQLSLVCGCLMR